MYQNFIQQDINQALPNLCRTLLRKGEENGSRNGTVKELTHVGITLTSPLNREILVDSRKANIAAQIAETMWVLTGRDDMDFLSHYLPRATDYSDDGTTWRGAYGPRLRAWIGVDPRGHQAEGIDQWAHCLDLLRADPLTRRAVMTIYDPATDTEPGLDIPCNNWITFSSRLGKLDMHVGIRSNDLLWGWSGINAFEWSAMLEISAGLLGIGVGSLHFSTTSLHLYAPHWAKAEKIAADLPVLDLPDSPRFDGLGRNLTDFDGLADEWFTIERAIRKQGGHVAGPVDNFPEPMMRSWLRVLQWWWSGDHAYLQPLAGTRLEYATHVAMQPPARIELPGQFPRQGPQVVMGDPDEMAVQRVIVDGEHLEFPPSHEAAYEMLSAMVGHQPSEFVEFAIRTHNEKHLAYGDSWKRRGEMLGILANIARKVDRLGGAETSDETSADTAMDLMVYLAKYSVWLEEQGDHWDPLPSDTPTAANELLLSTDRIVPKAWAVDDRTMLEDSLRQQFDRLEDLALTKANRTHDVKTMLRCAYLLARYLYDSQKAVREALLTDDYLGADHE